MNKGAVAGQVVSFGMLLLLAVAPANGQLPVCKKLNGAKADALVVYLQGDRASLPANCVLFAIDRLGLLKYEPAIPLLVKYLEYRPTAADPSASPGPTAYVYPSYGYPATSALFEIGEPAMPALIAVIASADSSEVLRTNAGDTIYAYYSRKDVSQAIAVMMRASREENDWGAKLRLEKAARYWASKCPLEYRNGCNVALQ